MTAHSILFVCTANRCRSPMAEGIWRKLVSDLGEVDDWSIGSAGTWTANGYPTMPHAEKVLADRGINMSRHESRVIERALLNDYNLILSMERGHKEALQAEFSEHRERIYLLTEMIGQKYDIRDPVAGTLLDYETTAAEIERILNEGRQMIQRLSSKDAA